MMAACGATPAAQEDETGGMFFRTADTTDSGLWLDPQCADPGFCGCDYVGYDLEAPVGDETCVHIGAVVDGVVGAGALVEAGAYIGVSASLGTGSVLGENALLAPRSQVGDNTTIGANAIIGRGASVGDRSEIGDDSVVFRNATIGDDVDASVGLLSLGYASSLGDRSEILGTGVVIGNLTSIGADSTLGANVVIARGATFGDFTAIGASSVIGPEVSALGGITLGTGVRIRKGVTLADDVNVGSGVRIGRDSELREGAQVSDNAVLRAAVTVGTYYTVDEDAYIPRGTTLEDQSGAGGGDPFSADALPVVVITSPLDGVNSNSGSVTITGTVSDDYGVNSVTLRIDDGSPVSVPYANGAFTYTVNGIPDLAQTLRVSAFDTLGQVGSDLLYLSDCSPSVSITHTWTGASDSDWDNTANWSAGTVPGSTSRVFVCGDTPIQPALAQNTSVQRIYMDSHAELASNGHSLTVSSAYAGGKTTGTGSVIGAGGTFKGTVPNLVVAGDITLNGVLVATGNAQINAGTTRIRVGNAELRVQGDFEQTISTTTTGLYMRSALGQANLEGSATFGGGSSMHTSFSYNPLTRGVVRVGGDLTLPCAGRSCLLVLGTSFEFVGDTVQNVSIANGGPTNNRFAATVVRNTAGVSVDGTLATQTVSLLNGGALAAPVLVASSTTAPNQLTGGASLSVSGTAHIYGPIEVADISSITATELTAERSFEMSTDSVYSGDLVILKTQLVVPSNHYTAVVTDIQGDITAPPTWDHTLPLLRIPAGTNRLRINTSTLHLNGNFEQFNNTTTTGLYMRSAAGDVTITGSAVFGGTANMHTSPSYNPLTAGTLRIGGDVSLPCDVSHDCMAALGTHVVLNGSTPQTVTIAAGGLTGNRFYDVDIQNPTSVTVIGNLAAANTLSVTGGGSVSASTLTANGASQDNVFSNDSTLLVSESAVFTGPIVVTDTSTLNIDFLTAQTYFSMSPGSTYIGNDVHLMTQLVIPSDDYRAQVTEIRGYITVLADWDHTMPLMRIPPGSHRLQVNDKLVVLNGDFEQDVNTTTTGLYMRTASGDVTITGSAEFGGTSSMHTSPSYNPLTAGTLRIAGDVSLPCAAPHDCFAPLGVTTVLDGDSPQAVSITEGGDLGNRFHHLTVSNPTTVSVTGDLAATALLMVTNGTTLVAPSIVTSTAAAAATVQQDAQLAVDGPVTFAGPFVVEDTSTITITELTTQSTFTMSSESHYAGDRVILKSGWVIPSDDYQAAVTEVRGDVYVQGDWNHTVPKVLIPPGAHRLRINGHTVRIDGDFEQRVDTTTTGLYLRSGSDSVTITGDALFGGTTGMHTSGSYNPMTSGSLRIQGNMTLPCPVNADCFLPLGTAVTLNGSSPQTLTVSGGGINGNRFHDLLIANPTGVTAVGNVRADGALEVSGTFTNPVGATAETNEDLVVDGGTINNQGTLRYNGSYTPSNGGTVSPNAPVNY
jgi:NDP-sugar pyrophosphorylase family protein